MYPVLLKIGPVTIHTVSILHALGFVAGISWIMKYSDEYKLDKEKVYDFSLVIIVYSIIGARIFSILFDGELAYFLEHPVAMLKVWNGGLTFYGGFLFAAVAGVIYVKKHDLDLPAFADLAAPALALGLAVGRLGCFASGDSFGRPTNSFWAVVFSDPHSVAPVGIPLHPTQLYSVITNFLIFAYLIFLKRKRRYKGQLAFVFAILYGISRSIVEIFRNDPRGVYFGGIISTSQVISAIFVGATLVLYFMYRKEGKLESV